MLLTLSLYQLNNQHGRAGLPKLKTFIYNAANKEFEWHDVGAKSRVSVFFGMAKATTVSSIALPEIVEIRKGIQTSVLSKAENLDPAKSFSFLTAKRSLDVVMASMQDRDTMLRAVKHVMDDAGLSPLFT